MAAGCRAIAVVAAAAVVVGGPPAASAVDLPGAATVLVAPPPLPFEVALPARVDAIAIEGLWRTRPEVATRELPWRPGEVVSVDSWRLGVARLWNTGLFSRVSARLEARGGRTVAVVVVEERWTINPVFSFQAIVKRPGAGENSAWWTAGAVDHNVGGRYLEAGVSYEEFNRLGGGLIYLRDPRLFGRRIDALVLAERTVRPRIGFADRRTRLRAEVNGLFADDRLRAGLRVEAVDDSVFDAGDTVPALPPASRSIVGDLGLRWGRVDVERIRQHGSSVEVRPGIAVDVVGGSSRLRAQIWSQFLGFWIAGPRWNLALRAAAAAQGEAPASQRHFLGGLAEVRGVRDSLLRADRFVLVNAEARCTTFDSTWFALVAAGFFDAAVARDAVRGPVVLASWGVGVRALVPRFVRTGLRVDFAMPIAGSPCPAGVGAPACLGLSLGVFQYF